MKNSPVAPWIGRVTLACVFLSALPVSGEYDEARRAERVTQIKSWIAEHGEDASYPHGRTWHVDNQAPGAVDDNEGTEAAPFKTINRAAQLALPGDTVLVSRGIYREHVSPTYAGYNANNMVQYVARHRHQVVVKGSEIWRPKWRKTTLEGVQGDVWQAELDPELFTYDFPIGDFNPFLLHNQGRIPVYDRGPDGVYRPFRPYAGDGIPPVTRGMIFMNGEPLLQARSRASRKVAQSPVDFATASDTFFVAADGESIYARFNHPNPEENFFEITVREQVFAPQTTGVSFIHVQGFVMEHGATTLMMPQYGMVSPSSGSGGWHWMIEDNIIRWSNACGLDIGIGFWGEGRSRTRPHREQEVGEKPLWRHWIKGNAITDNGTSGIWSIGGSSNAVIEYNRIERNCWQNTMHMVEAAALKMHGCDGVVLRGNLVRDNDNFGLWLDIVGPNNRVTQNLLLNNMTAGVFIEGTWGHTLVDNNIAAFPRTFAFRQMNMGDGFYNHQSSYVTFAHNLAFANGGYGYRCLMWGLQRSDRFPDDHVRVSHNRVLNNIAYANGRGAIALPLDQDYCKDNLSDHNFIWGASGQPLFELHRAIMDPDEMMAKVESAMARANVGADQVPLLTQWKRGLMGPNVGDMRHFGPLVSMEVWRAAQGRDMRSVVGPLPTLWLSRQGQMEINLDAPDRPIGLAEGESERVFGATPENYRRLDQVKCVAIPETEIDYFGDPRPKDVPPTVGPFQDLEKLGLNQRLRVFLRLWPIDRSRQPPAESLRIDRPFPELDEQEKAVGEVANEIWAQIEKRQG